MPDDEITEEAAELETLEVETRTVEEADEIAPMTPEQLASRQRALAQKIREHKAGR